MKRKYYLYHLYIKDHHLERSFKAYQKQHPNISFRRQARAFLLKNGYEYRFQLYERDFISNLSDELYRIAKTPWVNED